MALISSKMLQAIYLGSPTSRVQPLYLSRLQRKHFIGAAIRNFASLLSSIPKLSVTAYYNSLVFVFHMRDVRKFKVKSRFPRTRHRTIPART